MKRIIPILFVFLLFDCSSVEIINNWKNPDIDYFESSKVLIVGMTPNANARHQFEKKLKQEYEARGIEAHMSLDFFEPDFTLEKKSENEIKHIKDVLITNNFDTVLFTKVIGIEDKIAYKENYDGYEETHIKFKEDYLKYQDIYYNPDYYHEYSVYHTETSLYCLFSTKDRELIWKGFIDITDPQSVDETIDDYVRLVIIVLEEQNLIIPKIIREETTTEEAIK